MIAAAALALGTSGVALADDSTMSRFGGDSYTYFNHPASRNAVTGPTWRQSHPNGLTELELQALSASSLATPAFQVDRPVFASAPADPVWRQGHRNGMTEPELQALSSSSLAMWQTASGTMVATDRSNVAQGTDKETFSSRLAHYFRK